MKKGMLSLKEFNTKEWSFHYLGKYQFIIICSFIVKMFFFSSKSVKSVVNLFKRLEYVNKK